LQVNGENVDLDVLKEVVGRALQDRRVRKVVAKRGSSFSLNGAALDRIVESIMESLQSDEESESEGLESNDILALTEVNWSRHREAKGAKLVEGVV